MQPPVRYHIDLTHRRQHLVTVTLIVPSDCAQNARVSLPCWTPGSYLRRDYIRHLQQIAATDETGASITLNPIDGDAWQIPQDVVGDVTITLELFANEPSVRTNTVDATHALLIAAATCLNVSTATTREHHVTVPPTEPHHSVYALLPAHPTQPHTFVATDYHHLVDGAFSVGEHTVLVLDIEQVTHTFVWAGPSKRFNETIVIDTLKVVAPACAKVFDTPLQTDTYTILTITAEHASGGLEHRDGAVLHVPEHTFEDPESIARFQSLLAHEYLHAWNVKRLIPKDLLDLRYDTVVRSQALWFAEGFTAYYDGLLSVRAGLWEPERLLARFGRIYTELARTPGVNRQSLTDASWRAPERQYRRDENAPNAMTEYYAHGSLVAFELEALLRDDNPDGDGLDGLMRHLWRHHHNTGYTNEDVFAAVATIANDTVARRFASRVTTPGLADASEFADAISALGLTLNTNVTGEPWLGIQLSTRPLNTGVKLAAALRDGPAWQAGLTGNDTILALDDSVVSANTFADVLARYQPGDVVNAKVLRPTHIEQVPMTVTPTPATFTITNAADATTRAHTTYRRWLHQTAEVAPTSG